MTKLHFMGRLLAATAAAGALAASQAIASPAYAPADGGEVMTAAADCYSVGEQVASQYGGTLAKASQQNRGGQTVCVIVVLVPGKDGQRPRRTEVVVPAN
jgi:surface antigen